MQARCRPFWSYWADSFRISTDTLPDMKPKLFTNFEPIYLYFSSPSFRVFLQDGPRQGKVDTYIQKKT